MGEDGSPTDRLVAFFRDAQPEGILAAYLFGSHAEDRAHRESDLDVGVLLARSRFPASGDRSDLRVRLTSDLIGATHRNDIDVVVLNDAPPELARHVVTRGRRIFCSDAEADHAFVRDVQLRAADLAPFLERMRRIKLRTLRDE